MAYVDLNPTRSAIAEAPETSDYTRIKERIQPQFNLADAVQNQIEQQALNDFCLPLKPLLGFEGVVRNDDQRGILFGFDDYLELVDCSGRITRNDKRGAIDERALLILESNKYSRPSLSWGRCLRPIPTSPFPVRENLASAAFQVSFINIMPN